MADVKISGLPASTLPLAGTEVLPLVQSGVTKKVASDNLTVKNVRSNATTGILQIAGPAAASTRVMTTPDANFTAARTDAAQTFTGTQTFGAITATGGAVNFSGATSYSNSLTNAGYTPQYTGATCRGIEVSSGNSDSGTFGIFARQQASSATTTDNRGVSIQGYSGYFGANVTDLYNAKQPLINLTQEYQRFLAGNGRAIPQVALYMGYSDGATRVDYARRFLFSQGGDLTLDTGNLVIGTSGKGIDFSATPGTGTSELLADYEEGTWTPTDASGAGLSFTVTTAFYTKVGRAVHVQALLTYPATADVSTARVGGLPYTAINADFVLPNQTNAGLYLDMHVSPSTATFYPQALYNGNGYTNATLSGKYLMFSGTYFTS